MLAKGLKVDATGKLVFYSLCTLVSCNRIPLEISAIFQREVSKTLFSAIISKSSWRGLAEEIRIVTFKSSEMGNPAVLDVPFLMCQGRESEPLHYK